MARRQRVKLVVRGKQEAIDALDRISKLVQSRAGEIKDATAGEFYDYALNVLSYSVARAPVDKGDLRGTAYLEINGARCADGNEDGTIYDYGTPAYSDEMHARVVFPAPYALYQHEHSEFDQIPGRQGQSHYLEIGFDEATREFLNRAKKP